MMNRCDLVAELVATRDALPPHLRGELNLTAMPDTEVVRRVEQVRAVTRFCEAWADVKNRGYAVLVARAPQIDPLTDRYSPLDDESALAVCEAAVAFVQQCIPGATVTITMPEVGQ